MQRLSAGLFSIALIMPALAQAGTCTVDHVDCDGDDINNAVDLCPFTASADNTQTSITYIDSTTPLPTGNACTDASVIVWSGANLGQGIELHAGAIVMPRATVGDYAVLGGGTADAILGSRAGLAAAGRPEDGLSFRSGVLGRNTTVGQSESGQGPENTFVGSEFIAGRDVYIAPGTRIGDRVTLGYGVRIESGARLGDDVVLGPHVRIQARVAIGDNVVLGREVSVGVDAEVGDNVVVGPVSSIGDYANIGGTGQNDDPVRIRRNSHIGPWATVSPGTRIGREAQIGQCAVVRPDITLRASITLEDGAVACSTDSPVSGVVCREGRTIERGTDLAGIASNVPCNPDAPPCLNNTEQLVFDVNGNIQSFSVGPDNIGCRFEVELRAAGGGGGIGGAGDPALGGTGGGTRFNITPGVTGTFDVIVGAGGVLANRLGDKAYGGGGEGDGQGCCETGGGGGATAIAFDGDVLGVVGGGGGGAGVRSGGGQGADGGRGGSPSVTSGMGGFGQDGNDLVDGFFGQGGEGGNWNGVGAGGRTGASGGSDHRDGTHSNGGSGGSGIRGFKVAGGGGAANTEGGGGGGGFGGGSGGTGDGGGGGGGAFISDDPRVDYLFDLVGGRGGSGNGVNAPGEDGQVIMTLRRQAE